MKKITLTNREKLAFGVAVVADLLELPVGYIESFHFEIIFLFGELLDIILDFITMGIMTLLLGWNWAFLPSLLVEAIPISDVDLCPSWVASVAYVVWQKKKTGKQSETEVPISAQDERTIENVGELPALKRIGPPPIDSAAETRLKKLTELLEKSLISQDEYEAKRKQILVEL